MNKKYLAAFFIVVFMLSFTSATINVYEVKDSSRGTITKAVIDDNYKIHISGDLSGDASVNLEDSISLISYDENNNLWIYSWNTSLTSGERIFTIGEDSFTFPVISKVDEVFDRVSGLTVFVGNDHSYVEISGFNLDDTSLEMQHISYNQYSANINFAHFLDGLEANISIYPEDNYPIVNQLSIFDYPEGILDLILGQTDLGINTAQINNDPQEQVEFIMNHYGLSYDYDVYANLVKSGDYYKAYFSKGYDSIQSNNLQGQIYDFINSQVQYFNPLEISDEIFKLTEYSLTDYLELDLDYQVAMDFSGLSLISGEYTIYFDYVDNYGNQGVFPFTVILEITPSSTGNVENNTFVPPTQDVLEVIQEISGLDDNQTVSIEVHGSSLPIAFTADTPPNNINQAISFIEINISSGNTGNYKVNFSVPDNYNKNRIQAYVYEDDGWNALTTVFRKTENFKHYFYFITPHFSQFAIVEKETSPTSGNNPGGCSTYWVCGDWSSCVNGLQSRECFKEREHCSVDEDMPVESRTCSDDSSGDGIQPGNLINLNNQQNEQGIDTGFNFGITGAIIGALGSPTGMLIVFFVLILIGILVYFSLKKKKKLKKDSEKEESPPISEEVNQEELEKEAIEEAKKVKPTKSKKQTKKKSKKSSKKSGRKKNSKKSKKPAKKNSKKKFPKKTITKKSLKKKKNSKNKNI